MSLLPSPYSGIDIIYSLPQQAAAIHLFRMDAQGNPLSLVADTSYNSGTITDNNVAVSPGSVYRYAFLDDQGNLVDFASLYTATNLSASVNGHTAVLNWANNDSTLQFDVQRTSSNSVMNWMDTGNLGNLSSYTDNNLAADSVFTYQVNELTGNTTSNSITFAIAPDAPAYFNILTGGSSSPGANDQLVFATLPGLGPNGEFYNIYDASGGLVAQTSPNDYSSTLSPQWWQQIAPGTTYTYSAVVHNPNTGLESAPRTASFTTPFAAPAVTALPINATATSAFSGKVAGFIPSGSQTQPADYTASIDWGDSTSPSTGTIGLDSAGNFIVSGQHTYDISAVTDISNPLNTTVTVTHTSSGLASSGGGTATVAAPVAPSVTAAPISATAGQPFSGQVASFVGVGPDTSASEYTALIIWGDDSATGNTAGTVTRAEDGTFTVSGDHTYANAGNCNYSVTITHTASGEQGIGSGTAAIAYTAPVVTPHPFRAASGQSSTNIIATFTGSTAMSQAGDYTVSDITWADGSSADTVQILDNGNGTFSVEDTHAFSAAGNYTADVTVTHIYSGLFGSTSASSNIVPPGTPLVSVDPASATEGEPFSNVVASFTPTADTATVAADYNAQITLGGQTFAGIVADDGQGGFTVSVPSDSAPTFDSTGNQSVTVSVAYSGGGSADTQNGTLSVADAPIHLTSTSIDASRAVTFNGTVATLADDNPSSSPGDFTATIDWGDGTTPTTGTVDGDFNITGNHTYLATGDYTVTVTATDAAGNPDGATDSSSQDITVAETAPDAPTGLSATAVGDDEIDLSWNASPFATGYTILRDDGTGTFWAIGSVTLGATSYQDTNDASGLAPNTQYQYRVQATNDGGSSPDSNTATATTTSTAPIAQNDGGPAWSWHHLEVARNVYRDIPVLANDRDPDNLALTVDSASLTQPQHGTVTLDGDAVRYTPDANYAGPDSFTYKATDGVSASAAATVQVNVTAPDLSSGSTEIAYSQPGSGVVATNDVYHLGGLDPTDDNERYITVTGAAGMTLAADGTLTVTSAVSPGDRLVYKKEDQIGNTVFDGNLSSAGMDYLWIPTPGTVNAAAGQTVTKPAGTLQGTANGFGSLSVEIVDSSQIHGALSVAADGSYTYTPDASFVGESWFTYQVRDSGAPSNGVPGLSLYVTAFFNVASNVPAVDVSAAGGTPSQTDGDNPNYAASADPARFVFTRNGDLTQSLTANVTVSGIAVKGTDYRWAAADAANNIVSLDGGTIQFPAGQSTVKAILVPINSGTPEWTRDVKVQVTPASGGSVPAYEVGSSPTATQNITGADLAIKLGDNSDNQVIQGSGDGRENLVPLTLTFPTGYVAGDTVTLSELTGAHGDVWTTSTPSATDKPLLKDGQTSITLPANQMPRQLWFGATQGSVVVGQLQLALAGSDVNARQAPPGPRSESSASTKPASVILVRIIPATDPNGTGKSDWTNLTQGWLIGQMVDLFAQIDGPSPLIDNARFSWRVPGVVFRAYYPEGNVGYTIPVRGDDGGAVDSLHGETHTGSALRELVFFWEQGSGDRIVSLQINNVSPSILPVDTHFDLKTPTTTFARTSIGIAGVSDNGARIGVYGAWHASPEYHDTVGIVFAGKVTQPSGFATGQSATVQLVADLNSHQTTLGSGPNPPRIPFHDNHIGWWLDNSFPYQPEVNTSDEDIVTDAPNMGPLGTFWVEARYSGKYEMFQMYLPPGAESQWVPLIQVGWQFDVQVQRASTTAAWTITTSSATSTPVAGSPNEPTWTRAYVNQQAFNWQVDP